jgi:hypothetical protein
MIRTIGITGPSPEHFDVDLGHVPHGRDRFFNEGNEGMRETKR